MTTATASASSVVTWGSNLLARFGAVLRDGLRIWWLAPVIPALVVVPEFVQHVIEIRIGMFDSLERAREAGDSAQRMIPGYFKVAGLILAIFAAVRFWGAHANGARWTDWRAVRWKAFFVAFAILVVTSVPIFAAQAISEAAGAIANLVVGLAILPVYVLIVRALAHAPDATLGSVYRTGWAAALLMAALAILTWMPLQALHGLNHRWAIGASPALVWALMVFDSLVVGLLATYAGTALHHGSVPLARREDQPAA